MTRRSPRKRILPVVQAPGLVVPIKSVLPVAVAERKRMALYGYAQGKTSTQIAIDIGVSRKTLFRWARDDKDFFEQKERIMLAREDALAEADAVLADEMEDIMVSLARGETTKDGVPHFTAAHTVAKATNPARWGDKKQVDHTAVVIHSLIPNAVRLDELPRPDVLDDPDMIDVIALDDGEEDG